MGVPAFFRWLSRKYPSIIVHCVEAKAQQVSGNTIPVDATQPNPNEVEFDNLYLDMNGIIHPCCHPEDKPAPKNEDEMMAAIFEYIDRIFNIVRPRRLLYMAIDGVAPRAKMNQQRSRRFRAAKESIEKREEISRVREGLEARGCQLPPPKPKDSHFDSNCITPGTEFMARLAVCLQYYVHERMNNNPAWQGIRVILSDANVPGEGEHKIMDYIRRQRGQPDHDPNTHHCLYGADADLIMLGLATHELHFTILREEFKPNQAQNKPCEICGQVGHTLKECTGEAKEQSGEFDQFTSGIAMEKQFIFIRLCVLREYLERELRIDGLPFPFELERAIDDWVFMCFFVGNDFLPHLPSLEIREGAIDKLIRLYKQVVPQTHGYLTFSGRVNLPRVQIILAELGKVEDETFKNRRERDMEFRRRNRAKRQRMNTYNPTSLPRGQFAPQSLDSTLLPLSNPRQQAFQMRTMSTVLSLASNQNAASSLKDALKQNRRSLPASLEASSAGGSETRREGATSSILGQKRQRQDEDNDSEPEDNVRLWEDGWKERYYRDKFGVPSDDDEFRKALTEQYTRGLCWVLGYYYQGCPSWKWFYPFHYAPFSSDFKNIKEVRSDFELGTTPFRPLEQLMGVFPESSGNFLPPSWRRLMRDHDSPIIDFYPTNFRIDLNGKKYAWQGVALLPFVDEDRLHKALAQVYPDTTPEENERNSLGVDRLFLHNSSKFFPVVKELYDRPADEVDTGVEINPEFAQGMRGVVSYDKYMAEAIKLGGVVNSTLPDFPVIRQTRVLSCAFKDPTYPEGHIFEAKLLPGVTPPRRVLRPTNYQGNTWRPQTGFATPPPASRSHSTPESAQRMIRHSLSDPRHASTPSSTPSRGRGSPNFRGEMYSSQGASHGFRGVVNDRGVAGGFKYGTPPSRNHSDGYYGGGGYGNESRDYRYGGEGAGSNYGNESGGYGYGSGGESGSKYENESRGYGYGGRGAGSNYGNESRGYGGRSDSSYGSPNWQSPSPSHYHQHQATPHPRQALPQRGGRYHYLPPKGPHHYGQSKSDQGCTGD